MTASGAARSNSGTNDRHIATFAAASSSRVCPGFCFAPAVITTTSASAQTAGSYPPVTVAGGTNCKPWFRSSTSASSLAWFTSYSTISRATPRISPA